MTESFSSLDPATGEVLAQIPITSTEELHAKVARARAAPEGWAALDVEERCARIASAGPRIL
ncbi:MAG: aldehyde dehydrogenase family protein, partial [Planctomycetota bacterium]